MTPRLLIAKLLFLTVLLSGSQSLLAQGFFGRGFGYGGLGYGGLGYGGLGYGGLGYGGLGYGGLGYGGLGYGGFGGGYGGLGGIYQRHFIGGGAHHFVGGSQFAGTSLSALLMTTPGFSPLFSGFGGYGGLGYGGMGYGGLGYGGLGYGGFGGFGTNRYASLVNPVYTQMLPYVFGGYSPFGYGRYGSYGPYGWYGAYGAYGGYGPSGYGAYGFGPYGGFAPYLGYGLRPRSYSFLSGLPYSGYSYSNTPYGVLFTSVAGAYTTGPSYVRATIDTSPAVPDPAPVNSAIVDSPVAHKPDGDPLSPAEVGVAIAEAKGAFRVGGYADAIELAGKALQGRGSDPDLHELVALSRFAMADYRGAAIDAHTVLQTGKPADWSSVVAYYGDAKKYTGHLRALESKVQDNPNDWASVFLLGYHYSMLGHKQKAIEQLANAVMLAPRDAEAKKLLYALMDKRPPSKIVPLRPVIAHASPINAPGG